MYVSSFKTEIGDKVANDQALNFTIGEKIPYKDIVDAFDEHSGGGFKPTKLYRRRT